MRGGRGTRVLSGRVSEGQGVSSHTPRKGPVRTQREVPAMSREAAPPDPQSASASILDCQAPGPWERKACC